jgi:hypothetical protein
VKPSAMSILGYFAKSISRILPYPFGISTIVSWKKNFKKVAKILGRLKRKA